MNEELDDDPTLIKCDLRETDFSSFAGKTSSILMHQALPFVSKWEHLNHCTHNPFQSHIFSVTMVNWKNTFQLQETMIK